MRGNGFLQGLVFHADVPAMDVVASLRKHHVLSVPASENTVRLLPPLNITEDEIHHLLSVLGDVLAAIRQS